MIVKTIRVINNSLLVRIIFLFVSLLTIASCEKEEISCSINLRVENATVTKLTDILIHTVVFDTALSTNSYDSLDINSISDYKEFESFNPFCFTIMSNEYTTYLSDCMVSESIEKGNYTFRIIGNHRDTLIKD